MGFLLGFLTCILLIAYAIAAFFCYDKDDMGMRMVNVPFYREVVLIVFYPLIFAISYVLLGIGLVCGFVVSYFIGIWQKRFWKKQLAEKSSYSPPASVIANGCEATRIASLSVNTSVPSSSPDKDKL